MFKCTDCGKEYEIKPDYCDCGNNAFESTAPREEPAAVAKIEHVEPKIRYKRPNPRFNIPSLIIFFTCIILSILSIIFIGRNSTRAIPDTKPEMQATVEIPAFESIWKETPVQKSVTPAAAPAPTIVTAAAKPATTQTNTAKTVKQPVTQPAMQPRQPKPAATQQSASMTEQQKQEIVKKLTTPKVETTEVKVDEATQRRELLTYKTELRDKIGKNINFTTVIGDGKCAVTFKIDSSGNLINRSFSVQSTNTTLNDAVYSAMMHNPTFKAPPEGYKNETLTLSVQIYSGSFEVSLK